MSNHLAIATVTAALAQLVRDATQSAVPGSDVLLGRPEAPAGSAALARARLYLYQVSHNAGLRNADLPGRNAAGDLVKRPAAALNLHYLVSFYGDENTLEPQRMLAAVARDLHGQPGLTRAMIRNAAASQLELNDSDLADALEQVKFTPLDLSMDEWTKLWSVFFQTPHAPSLAYQASVVLIESVDRAPGGLPVLRRGDQDQGIDALIGPFPSLGLVHVGDLLDADRRPRLPALPAARLGDLLTFAGQNLGGDSVSLVFSNPRLANPIEVAIPAADRTASELRLILPSDAQAAPDVGSGRIRGTRGDHPRRREAEHWRHPAGGRAQSDEHHAEPGGARYQRRRGAYRGVHPTGLARAARHARLRRPGGGCGCQDCGHGPAHVRGDRRAGPDQGGRQSARGRRRKPAFRPVGQPASLRL